MRIFDSLSSPWFRHDQEMIVSDLLDKKTLAKAISGCEVVYNFAAIADLDEVLNKTIETANINVIGGLPKSTGATLYLCQHALCLQSCCWSKPVLQQARLYFCHRLLRTLAQ